MRSTLLESNAGPRNEIFDSARDEHFAGRGVRRHARPDVNSDAADLLADDLAFSRVETAPDFETERANRVANAARAANRALRTVERGKETVARGTDFPAAE